MCEELWHTSDDNSIDWFVCLLMHLVINWLKFRVRTQGVHALRNSDLDWTSYDAFQDATTCQHARSRCAFADDPNNG